MQLLHNNGPLSQIEISKLLECDKAHIHRTVSRLIEKGYVVRLDEKEHIKNMELYNYFYFLIGLLVSSSLLPSFNNNQIIPFFDFFVNIFL